MSWSRRMTNAEDKVMPFKRCFARNLTLLPASWVSQEWKKPGKFHSTWISNMDKRDSSLREVLKTIFMRARRLGKSEDINSIEVTNGPSYNCLSISNCTQHQSFASFFFIFQHRFIAWTSASSLRYYFVINSRRHPRCESQAKYWGSQMKTFFVIWEI